jgi:hypothetical protein
LAAVTWGITLTQATALTDWAVGTLPLNQCLTVLVDGLRLLLKLPLSLLGRRHQKPITHHQKPITHRQNPQINGNKQ